MSNDMIDLAAVNVREIKSSRKARTMRAVRSAGAKVAKVAKSDTARAVAVGVAQGLAVAALVVTIEAVTYAVKVVR